MNHLGKVFFSVCMFVSSVYGQSADIDLGNEYTDHGKERYQRSGAQKGSGRSASEEKDADSFLYSAVMYVPNRVLDILDIFRFDVGVGPAVGAVVRITPYGQAGARLLMPVSVRAGLRGRRSPIFIEHSSEMGIGPAYLGSESRKPTPLEVGLGADLFIAGAYAGVSIDSIWDALAGFVGFDPSEDDL